jgi:hypothetical protein
MPEGVAGGPFGLTDDSANRHSRNPHNYN